MYMYVRHNCAVLQLLYTCAEMAKRVVLGSVLRLAACRTILFSGIQTSYIMQQYTNKTEM